MSGSGALNPPLHSGEVHVWRVRVNLDQEVTSNLRLNLDPDETRRAEAFKFERDRTRFTVAHAALRIVLSEYAGAAPSAIRFGAGPQGKPFLSEPAGTDIRFNLAHSGDLALVAVTRRSEIGVDLERIRSMPDVLAVAERVFPPAEVALLRQLESDAQVDAFFHAWVRYEARIKATGLGMADSARNGGPENSQISSAVQPEWVFQELTVAPGYAAAVATSGPARIIITDWNAPGLCG